MVEIADINDRESLELWLKDQPRETARVIAHRSAMRVLPIYWEWAESARKRDLTALPILRLILITEAAWRSAILEITAAAKVAFDAAIGPTGSITITAAAVADATTAAATTTFTATATLATVTTATNAAFAADQSSDMVWSALRADCERLKSGSAPEHWPLWPGFENPLADLWTDLKTTLSAPGREGPNWSFWIRWYDAALSGRSQNWEMLEEIALIDPKDWDQGPVRVNALIREIEQTYALRASPNAEKINRDPVTNKFRAIPISDLAPDTFQNAKERAADAITQMRAIDPSRNIHGVLDAELELLEDHLSRYADNSQRLYEVFVKVVRRIDNKIGSGICPQNDLTIEDIRTDLDSSALDILNFDAEVEKTIKARASIRFARLHSDEKDRLASLSAAAVEESDANLGAEITEDHAFVVDENADQEDQDQSRYRLGSRFIRMGRIKRSDAVKAADDVNKIGKVTGSAWEFLGNVYEWFL